MTQRVLLLPVVAMMMCALSVRAEWTITTSDFQTFASSTLSLDGNGAVVQGDGQQRRLSWGEFLQAERTDPRPVPAGPLSLRLVGGDAVSGTPQGIEGEILRWSHPVAGELLFPLRRVVRIARSDASPAPRSDAEAVADEVSLANGDQLSGIITDLSADALTIQPTGLGPVPVPMEAVSVVRFASTGQRSPGRDRALRVRLGDGSTITAQSVTLNDAQATLTLPIGDPLTLEAAHVAAIEQVNGPVAWLSSLEPSESVQTPFLDSSFPAQMDKSVTGRPIRFQEQTFAHGIGVHSYSRLTWPLEGGYSRLRLRCAIDGDLPYANVTVRIKLDDRVVHEQADVTAGQLSPVIEIPLGRAQSLTLEADYGQTYDVQDRLNWIEPALVK